ncbi:right-handed parallel beta-helix repeat-containing protein [Halalkalibacter alkalisediminis]|uniref:Right handed beta helix domain-containing protein n=1 Tax=Halalkalibacter alkalisediminis TaxID=935616 RepID=A0ABV6NH08_9BACI|nr:right-handed parallel beta-helix repeat-containing protein [Halalkalibacter alkalisediminis]
MAKIQVKQGLKAELTTLDIGEFGFCIDTHELYIGTLSGNKLMNVPSEPGSDVKASTANGYIKVDGTDIKVYDDSTIKDLLDSMATTDDLQNLVSNDKLNDSLSSKANLKDLEGLISIEDLTNLLSEKANTEALADLVSIEEFIQALSAKSDHDHEHRIEEVTGLQASLDSKFNRDDIEDLVTNSELANKLAKKADKSDVDEYNNALQTKADVNHEHKLIDITDVDTTNKTNGHALLYDSTTQKFVSKALPDSEDSGVTTLDGLSDVDVSAVNEGVVLSYTGGIWKAVSLSDNDNDGPSNLSNAYVIELERWGITEGIPSKPYQDADYFMADQNIQGINSALQYASENGFTDVVLPRGKYALCYPKTINLRSHMVFHLNGSTLKVIYDSDRKSPFDTRTGTDYYNFKGNSITLDNVTNSRLVGGTIIGCRDDRSFAVSAERAQEHTYGVVFTRGTNHSSIKHCVVRDYMGDNITFTSESPRTLTEFNMNLSKNTVDQSTGNLTPSANTLTSGFISIPNEGYTSFLIAGFGFARQTSITTREVSVFFYKEDNTYIGPLTRRKIYTPISIPVGARKLRLVFNNETNPLKNMNVTIRWGLAPHHNKVEHNEVFNGHRGGITLGGSYNVVQNNVIRDNGKNFLDGKPQFNDPTRYGINQEDSYGDNCVIRNNIIYNTNHGILAGCYSILIENNHIYNVDSIAINIYTTVYANIQGNFIYNCGNTIGLMTAHIQNAHVHITNNSMHGGNTQLSGSGYDVLVMGNTFVDPSIITMSNTDLSVFKNNNIRYSSYYSGTGWITVNRLEGCIMEAKGQRREITVRSYEQIGCVYNNLILNNRTRNDTTTREKVIFHDCKFINCRVDNHLFGMKQRLVEVRKSKFFDSTIRVGNINTDNEHPSFIANDCEFIVRTVNVLVATEINRSAGYGNVELEKCNIEITNSSFEHLILNGFTVVRSIVIMSLKRCNIKYSSEGNNLSLSYYSNKNSMINFISVENKFENINLPQEDEGIYIGYDPITHNNKEPESGYFSLGKVINNASPIPGGYVGWICTSAGEANKYQWTTNTLYTKGQLVHANNKVYKCTVEGTSGSIAPNHTSGIETDGTVTWGFVDAKAVLKLYGPISE